MGISINCLFARFQRWINFCDPLVPLYIAVLKIDPVVTKGNTLR